MITFKELVDEERREKPIDNIMVVDSLNLAFRWKHKGQLQFEYDYLRTIESLAKSYNSGSVIITADWGQSSYRKEVFPDYKGNRVKLKANQTEAEAEAFRVFFKEYESTLKALERNYLVLRYKDVEADDLAAYICKKYPNNNIWLISSDKDWDLLVNSNISRFSYVTTKETTIFNWDEHHKVEPEDYISYKCLVGDTGDNIPGIPGIGPVKATNLIQTYGTAFDVYDACPIDSKYKYIQSLNDNCQQILVNYELMDLVTYCEDAIGEENIKNAEKALKEYLNEARL